MNEPHGEHPPIDLPMSKWKRKIEYRLCVDYGGEMRTKRYQKSNRQRAIEDLERFERDAMSRGFHYEEAWVEAREVTTWAKVTLQRGRQ